MEHALRDYCRQLDALGIGYEIVEHPPLPTLVELLYHLHLTFADGLLTVVVEADGRYVSFTVRGDYQPDLARLQQALRLPPARSMHLVGAGCNLESAPRLYTAGVPTVLDEQILRRPYLLGNGGSPTTSIRYRTSDLLRLPDLLVVRASRPALTYG